MPLPDFHVSDPFTLGIELELQVVNPPGYDLSQDSSALIAAVKNDIKAGEVKHDITETFIRRQRSFPRYSRRSCARRGISIFRSAAAAHIRFRSGSVRRCATTSATTARWRCLAT